jgi:hypothetical protein
MNTPSPSADPFGLPEQSLPNPVPRTSPPGSPNGRRKGRFLRGPVPLDWLEVAAGCGGKSMAVAVLLWFRRGLTGSPEVNVGRSLRDRFAIPRTTFRRALASLERAGLVTVERHRGRSPRITLLDPPTDHPP